MSTMLAPSPVAAAHAREESLDGLRLALASDTFTPQVNGVTRTLDRLVREVEGRGGEVRVFTTTDPHATADPRVSRAPSLPFWAYPQLRLAAPRADTLAAEFGAWKPHLVHVATPFGVGFAARHAARSTATPVVSSYHTSFSAYARFYQLGALQAPGWRYLRWFHNGTARTYCPTAAIAAELERRGFARTEVWGRGVDTSEFSPVFRSMALRRSLGIADAELVVAYVGRVAREKGIETLIDAMHRLDSGDGALRMRLLIVGDGPDAVRCRRRAGGRAIFTGRQHGERLAALYASADLFVFPSVTDTFGNVMLEAMASALPIVAADCDVSRELLGPVPAAFFHGGDADALATQLRRLGGDPWSRRRSAIAGRSLAEARSWPRVFDALFADYRRILRRRPVAGTGTPRRA